VPFLDFIKNRNVSQQQSVANKPQDQKPETAKEMHSRQAAQEKAAEKPITPEIKAQADRAMATINKASQHLEPQPAPAAPDGGSPAAHLQKQNHQEKAQPALSPTDGAAGKTAAQDKEKAPEKPVSRTPQTVPRRQPSWER
jgi:hypothetical protein